MHILKKGKNKSKASSYRPISLTSSYFKLLERIFNKRMDMYLKSENIVGHEQAGFRHYKSTEDQTTHLSQVVEDAFQSKKVTLAVFLDCYDIVIIVFIYVGLICVVWPGSCLQNNLRTVQFRNHWNNYRMIGTFQNDPNKRCVI